MKVQLSDGSMKKTDLFYSIDHMSEVVRDAIENRQRIKQELVLIQEDFLLNEVCIHCQIITLF